MASWLNDPKPEDQARVKPTEEMNMKSNEHNGNMEFGEKVLRGGVGMIMLETVLLTPALTPVLIASLSLAALYLVFTAIIGRDPVYALAKGTPEYSKPVEGSVTPYPPRSRVAHDQRKAA